MSNPPEKNVKPDSIDTMRRAENISENNLLEWCQAESK